MKIGDDTVVLVHKVATGQKDAYGQRTSTPSYVVIPRCMFAPTRTQIDENRGVPSINGATLITQPTYADLIAQADHVLYPATPAGNGAWTGPAWELVGDVGRWKQSTEVFLRRRT